MNTSHAWSQEQTEPACNRFLANHSAYIDGELSALESAAHEAHASSCDSCGRYARVLARGTELLRGYDEIEPSATFEARLQHRIFHLQDEAVLQPRQVRAWLVAAAVFAGALFWLRDPGDAIVPTPPPFAQPAAHPHEAVFALQRDVFTAAAVPIAQLPGGYTPVVVTPPQFRPVVDGTGAE